VAAPLRAISVPRGARFGKAQLERWARGEERQFITRSTLGALVLLLCAFFLQGIGITGCNVHVDSIRQALIPDHLQGRANASYRLLVSGAAPVGALLGGFLGAWIGLKLTLLVGAVGLLSTWLWVVCSPVPRLRRPPTPADELATTASEKPAQTNVGVPV
jgi:MFS family permease